MPYTPLLSAFAMLASRTALWRLNSTSLVGIRRREVDFGPRESLDEIDLFLGAQVSNQALLNSNEMQIVKVAAAENGIDYNDIRNPLTPQSKQFVELGYTHEMPQPCSQLSDYV